MVSMIKNILIEKVRSAGAMTDVELYKSMVKDESIISEDRFNKILLDMEIRGLIKVAWATKDERRIEATEEEPEYNSNSYYNSNDSDGSDSSRDGQSSTDAASSNVASDSGGDDMSYEGSFPGLEK